ncbi:putative hydrolase [Gordonia hirsuta DSM 44140 = NBRC 16056]|uniref:Putative hydrolase n=1 Tax=Gordonia hirsuta DSM 44140 = NBRC 16056 TaxID=1121927 RepID=L7L4M2_9ACTN|nr:HAD family hydrolase [Gordonia hirsuta]GAC56090.1 putative hydrolase [Gordonia hirsuta DSM 44140 = NBRC 16056]
MIRNERAAAADLPAALLWDMDGTILDTEPIWDVAMESLAGRHGVEMTPELRLATLGNNAVDALTKVYDAARLPESGRDFDGDEAWMVALVADLFTAELPWRPGARQTLDLAASADIPMLLVTNTQREIADVAIDTIGVERFLTTVCGDEVAVGKPAPDIYLRAAELAGAHPHDCLAIEDSPTGAAASHAAGVPTLVVPSQVPVPAASKRTFRDTLAGLTLPELAADFARASSAR